MKYEDKQMKTKGDFESDKGEVEFMFPHSPNPVTIRAKSREEAEEKFLKIISKK